MKHKNYSFNHLKNITMQECLLKSLIFLDYRQGNHIEHTLRTPYLQGQVLEVWNPHYEYQESPSDDEDREFDLMIIYIYDQNILKVLRIFYELDVVFYVLLIE